MMASSPVNPRGENAFVTSLAFSAIAAVVVTIRCVTRFFLIKRCGVDDILMACALAFSIALTALIRAQEQHGLGRHVSTVKIDDFVAMSKAFWISVPVYQLGLAFTKSSILAQFLRFVIDARWRKACWGVLTAVVLHGIAVFFASIFACTPIAFFWNRAIEGGHCINLEVFWFFNASFGIITDLILCTLPIPVLKSLQLPKRQKWALMFVFILGGFGCVTSILRLHSLYVISRSTDVTWDNVGAATWSSVELNTGIICGCLPTLKPVLARFLPRLVQSRTRNSVPLTPTYFKRPSKRHNLAADTASTEGINYTKEHGIETGSWQHGNEESTSPTGHQYSWSVNAMSGDTKHVSKTNVFEVGG